MRDLLEGMMLPFLWLWIVIKAVFRGIAVTYKIYMTLVGQTGSWTQGFIHSTVFTTIGMALVAFAMLPWRQAIQVIVMGIG